MNAANKTLNVGDRVLVLKKYGARPTTDNVFKVTKAGWIEIGSMPAIKFKADWRGEYNPTTKHASVHAIYPYSDEKLAELNETADRVEKELAEKKDREAKRIAAIEAEREAATNEVKAAVGDWRLAVRYGTTLGDVKLLTLEIPVRADLVERKGDKEVVIVKMHKRSERNWDTNKNEDVYEAYMTSAHKNVHSFSSRSGYTHKTEDAAMWEALRAAYTDW